MRDFESIAEEIINSDKYQSLKEENHHGLSRYDHSLRVARNTYRISKKMKLDYVSATRGALLHDYFTNEEYRNTKGMKKYSMHPVIALNNARREYKLNPIEENVIVSHMYPMGKVKPNCKESWLVSSVDKSVAIYECARFKAKEALAFTFVLVINFLHF
jgi:uncharacterized protein